MIIPKKIKIYNLNNIHSVPQIKNLGEKELSALKVVASVLPFRTNNYVLDELINWNNVPDDPIYQLNFMQKDMLKKSQFERMESALKRNNPEEIKNTAIKIRIELNPHPAGQAKINIPKLNTEPLPGLQHKYKETVLIFPSKSQTCHAYCSFCFRWAQFVDTNNIKFATCNKVDFLKYLSVHKDVTDILITGGDPMIMSAANLKEFILPLLKPGFEHLQSIRIGTKSLSYWPYRFVTDDDSDEILRLFEKIKASDKNITIMAHFNHYAELSTEVVKEAINRILSTGAQIRTQSPVIKYINNDPKVWEKMWKDQVAMGCVPYYMFVERDTGANNYFEIPLLEAFNIYREAIVKTSGLCRTVRGPVMSALPGKVMLNGVTNIYGEKVFQLSLIQARNPNWCYKPFYAKFDPLAKWLSHLEPALGEKKFFYQNELNQMLYDKDKFNLLYNEEFFDKQLQLNYD